jgi:hypothetical protein
LFLLWFRFVRARRRWRGAGDRTCGAPVLDPAYSGHQFNNVLSGVHSRFSDDMGLQLRIEMDDQMQGMMMALATVTDNVTNDGYLIMGSMMDAST